MILKTESAGGVVLNKYGEVLVVNQNGKTWSLPKGHVESQEDHMQAARREIYEESGVSDLNFVKELGVYQRYKVSLSGEDDTAEFKTITMYLFKTAQHDLNPRDRDNPEARWVKKEQVVELLTHYKDKEFFKRIIHQLE